MGLFSHIRSSLLLKNSATLLLANVVAQAIGLLVYPILTRLYSPEDFGLLNLFLTIGSFLILLATTDYQLAIMLPKDDREKRAMVHTTLCMTLFVSLLTLLSCLFAEPIARLFNMPELARWYVLLPFYVLFSALWNILSYWYLSRGNYARISRYQVSLSSLTAGLKIGMGYGGLLQGGMILSSVLAAGGSLLLSLWRGWKQHLTPLFEWSTRADMLAAARTYRKFPLYSFPSTLTNMLSSQLPVLLLTPVFGASHIGLWSMALLLGFAPLSMLSKTLSQTLYHYTIDKQHRQLDVRPFFRRFTLFGLLGIALVFIPLAFVLPQLTTWLLGEKWQLTGHIIRWLLPWLGLNTLTASTGFLAGIYFKQNIELLFEILMIAVRAAAIGLGIYGHDFMHFVVLYSVGSCVVTTAHYIWLMSLVSRSSTNSQQ